KDVNLQIRDKEFVVFVGPSGCGKTTTLRMIAGLEAISSGDISIDGTVVNNLAPMDRDIAMVFQNYALYPHMSVYDNMAFGLKMRKFARPENKKRVNEAADILDLTPHLDRKPAQLSGGQRQRVAMGRVIVRTPNAFLMDEPLSNLDAKLRVQMRTEVSRIQKRLGTTTVYVTHDQTEAMTLGDRVAVMRAGELQQVGTPQDLYERPKNIFVAGFIGSPAMNFMPVRIEGDSIVTPLGNVPLAGEQRRALQGNGRGDLIAGIRPEDFEDAALVGEQRDRGLTFRTQIEVLESMGAEYYAYFSVEAKEQLSSRELQELAEDAGTAEVPSAGEAGQVVARLDPASTTAEGQETELWLDTTKVHLFDASSGKRLGAAG
ncbi:MAG: ABC transporter ATP-binding protein, partial [Solirubrobacteraceae bacterium]